MNTEPLRPGPAPAGQPAWIYFECNKNGIYFEDGADAPVPHQWLPAPSAPPKPPAEKTVEDMDFEMAFTLLNSEFRPSVPQIIECIQSGRADGVRKFARELMNTEEQCDTQSEGYTKLMTILEEVAK